jgi:hypothetical protein
MKRLLLISMVWLWASAAPSFLFCDPPDWIWSLCPVNGHPQFFAFCPRLLKREKELSLCLEKAANQASKYKEISVNAGTFYRKKSFMSKYLMTLAIDFNRELAAHLLSDLAIVREYRNESGTYQAKCGSTASTFLSDLYRKIKGITIRSQCVPMYQQDIYLIEWG